MIKILLPLAVGGAGLAVLLQPAHSPDQAAHQIIELDELQSSPAPMQRELREFELISEPIQPVTVAFIGDQGLGPRPRAVLELIRSEGADVVLHQGDFDYDNDPGSWESMINGVLGADFPYFASVGNHDIDRFYRPDGYQAKLESRLNKIRDARCIGDIGVQSACTYKGLFFILSGVGTMPDRRADLSQVAFIREQLEQSQAIWKICSWHKNQRMMQVGDQADEVGWGPYEACREGGAIIATGHEHSYSRTHLLDSFQLSNVASTSSTLRITKGRSFAFVSGLGGKSIRDQDHDGDWWAAVYTLDQGANAGALFCTFFVEGEPNRASCYFKDIDGEVPDRFGVVSEIAPTEIPRVDQRRVGRGLSTVTE